MEGFSPGEQAETRRRDRPTSYESERLQVGWGTVRMLIGRRSQHVRVVRSQKNGALTLHWMRHGVTKG